MIDVAKLFTPYQPHLVKGIDLSDPENASRYRRLYSTKVGVLPKQKLYLESPMRRKAYIGGRGAGKTVCGCLAGLITADLFPKAAGTVVAPTYKMIHDAIWPWFKQLAGPLIDPGGYNRVHNEVKLVNGHVVRFRSADDPETLRGPTNAWFWIDEAALLDRYVYRMLLPTLRYAGDRGWAFITSTPRGKKNWLYDVFGSPEVDMSDKLLVVAKTAENITLPKGSAEDWRREFGAGWFARQELDGEFVDADSGLYREEWFGRVEAPSKAVCSRVVRFWDLAVTAKKKADWTVGVKVGIDTENYLWVFDVVRGQWEWPDAHEQIVRAAKNDGMDVFQYIESVGPQKGLVQQLERDKRMRGFMIYPVPVDRDKVLRALPTIKKARDGHVILTPGPWRKAFVDELCMFDGQENSLDDQADAFHGAYRAVMEKRYVVSKQRYWK